MEKLKSAEIVLAIITAVITVTKAVVKLVEHIQTQRKKKYA
jgi:hypothetical protein